MFEELGLQFLDMFSDVWGNPIGKMLYGIVAWLSLVGSAKNITGEQRANLKSKAQRDHEKRISRYTLRKFRMLKDRIWKMSKLFDKTGSSERIILEQGHKKVDHIKREYRRDYFEEARKIIFEQKMDELVYDADVVSNSFQTREERDNFLSEYARDFRELLLSDIHKVAGYNEDVKKLEDSFLTFDYVREMIENILTEVEKSDTLKIAEMREADKKYTISTFDIAGVLRSIKRREK